MQADLKYAKNATSPDFPNYLISNPNYKLRASSNPNDLLPTNTGLPGTIAVRDLRNLEALGRSPIKTAG
jgi:hypothetical protein